MRLFRNVVVLSLLGFSFETPAAQAPTATPEPAGAAATAPSAPAPAVSAEVASLQRDLGRIVREPGWSSAEYGVLVVSLDRGDTLFALNPDRPLAPASNMKLYTTAAALYYLGSEFRFSTYVLGAGEVRDSVIAGDLILFGTGDPSISGRLLPNSLSAFRALADSLYNSGIRTVEGGVIGDGSYFDDVRLGVGWNPSDLMAWYGAPIGALSFAENVVSVRVAPGSGAGQPARVTTAPATDGLNVANRVVTVASGRTRVEFKHAREGIVLEGRIARRHPGVVRSMPVVDPARFSAAALRAVLEEKGIEVRGDLGVKHDPAESLVTFAAPNLSPSAVSAIAPPQVLAVHLSPPLSDILRVTNVRSHNLFAEALLKTVGRVALGDGSFEGGARAIRYMLECEAGVDSATLRIVDGSGLSRLNRVTPRTTIQLLGLMAESSDWEAFDASLPEAADPGDTRGLRRRMGGTPAARNLRAKTGTIKRVSALSGYVEAANGELLAFSIIGNNLPSTWRAKRSEDAIGARLAAFRRPPPDTTTPARPDSVPALPAAEDSLEMPTTTSPAEAPAEPQRGQQTHTVAPGETLDGIAHRYGTTVEALQEQNPGVSPRRLQVGQQLRLPGNTVEPVQAPPAEPAAPAEEQIHRVRPGDTLDGIARRYGVTVRALEAANPGVNPRRLQLGQEIRVPGNRE